MISINDAEKMLVAYCLEGIEPTKMICDTLACDEDYFQDPSLRLLFASCCSLCAKGAEVSALTVQTFLQEEVHTLHFHGHNMGIEVERLITLSRDIAMDFKNLKHLSGPYEAVQFLKKESQRRKALQITMALNDKLMRGSEPEQTVSLGINDLMNFVQQIQNTWHQAYRTLPQTIAEAEQEINEEIAGKINSFSTGLKPLDKILNGLHKGRLYILGAEAKIGKSLLCNQIALHNALLGIPVGVISLEMGSKEIVKRLAGISQNNDPVMNKSLLNEFKSMTTGKPLYFRQGGVTGKTLFTALQKFVAEKKCQILILDYLQLIQLETKSGNAVDSINNVLAHLKSFSEEKQVVIILVSALLTKNLKGKKGASVEPTGADVAGTGRAVNDCDCMLLLWRPKKDNPRLVEVFVAQGRNGESGRVELFIDDKLHMTPAFNVDVTKLAKPKNKSSNLYSQPH